jgi:hypothetical protein
MNPPRLIAAALLTAAVSPLPAATIIRANTPGLNGMGASNGNIGATFGDNIALTAPGNPVFETFAGATGTVGTPDIGLTWSATGGTNANAWQFHTWGGAGVDNSGGGALQMDGSSTNSTFSIAFQPTIDLAVVLNSFNFIGDTNGDTYQYRVDIVNLTTAVVDFTTTTGTWTTATGQNPGNTDPDTWAGAPQVVMNFTGEIGTAYRLDLVRLNNDTASTGSRVDIAIDNLSFDQVPEPSSTLLGGVGLMLLLRRSRRSLASR